MLLRKRFLSLAAVGALAVMGVACDDDGDTTDDTTTDDTVEDTEDPLLEDTEDPLLEDTEDTEADA
jgi:hypothetical protein